jgi:Flp pilus assembly protein TadD
MRRARTFNSALALTAFYVAFSLAGPLGASARAQEPPPETPEALSRDAGVLLDRLGTLTAPEDEVEAARLAREVRQRWSNSGSPAMDLLLARGRDAIEDGDWPRALAHLTALTDHAPDWAEGWNARATAFFLSDRFGPAISDIEQVLILEPRHFEALSGLGIILEQLGELDAAADAFRRAAQEPEPPEALSRDADVLLDRLGTLTAPEDAVEAARLAREVRQRWSNSGSPAMDLLLTRGRDAIEEGDWPRALAHLTALTDHAPGWAEAWNARATAFFLSDRFGPALSDIEQVLILEPRHFEALAGLGIILEQLGEDEAALDAFRRAAQVYPAEPNVATALERLDQATGGSTL